MFIPEQFYRDIMKSVPIICVDLIIKNQDAKFLLVKRNNEPLKDVFYVVGGRVHLGETLQDAGRRKLFEEVGLETKTMESVGVYQDFFKENAFETCELYHTVSFVFATEIYTHPEIQLDKDAVDYVWSDTLPTRFVDHLQSHREV